MANVIVTNHIATWKEYFLHHSNMDQLNNNVDWIFQASHVSATTSPTTRFDIAKSLDYWCTIIASPMNRYVWFAHHFHMICNSIFDQPNMIKKHLALSEIDANARTYIVDLILSFSSIHFECPSFNSLLMMQLTEDLHAPLDPIAMDKEESTMTGVMFIPPFILTAFSNSNHLETDQLFFITITYINSWVAQINDETNDQIQDHQEQGKWLLQWLWAVSQTNKLPLIPLQPSPGAATTQWKQNLQKTNLHHPTTTTIINPMISATDQTPTTSSSTWINLSLTKIASLFEQQATEESKRSKLKEPSWAHLTFPSKMMILHAMSTSGLDATLAQQPLNSTNSAPNAQHLQSINPLSTTLKQTTDLASPIYHQHYWHPFGQVWSEHKPQEPPIT